MTPPLLSKTADGKSLQLYLAVSTQAVSAVLAREAESQQLPVYYISKTLLSVETRYSSLEKLVLALVVASRKIRHYFETHPIVVKTNYSVKVVLRRPELTGLGVVLKSPQGDMMVQAICCDFKATNNEAEYEALIGGSEYHLKIVCDNGSQFISSPTRNFWDKWNITLVTSTPRYPRANGQAEFSNKVIIGSLKKKLKDKKGKWAEELPRIRWANRTTPRTATGQTPFSLVYGCEAVIPTEVATPTARYGLMTPERNSEELSHDLDTVEERRDLEYIRMATYQQMVARSFNKNVKARMFKVGDWVLRKLFQNTQELNAGKLGATWEGPYQIVEVIGKGAYRLATTNGKLVPRSWNATHLKLYHF
ncbi:uncharacterized protein LOC110734930 [Chenopodium quinoa]|nr:uncharacterized protein LOC110734930 [Chenopodium quinoa]